MPRPMKFFFHHFFGISKMSLFYVNGNQTMKLGQLIDYNKRNIFLQKLCRK